MKRFIAVTLSVLTILSSTTFAADSTRFVYNGKEASISAAAIFKDGYTYLPAKQVFEAAGMKVIEKSSNNSLTAEAKGKSGYVSVWVGKTSGRMNGTNIHLGKAPFKENGVTYVSSKFIEEQLGVKVSYQQDKNTIYINSVGEGKITSTAYLNKNKSANKSTKKSAGKTVSNTGTTDFTAVTGIKPSGQTLFGVEYSNVSKADLDKYIAKLISCGYTPEQTQTFSGDVAYGYVKCLNYMSISKNKISLVSIYLNKPVNSKYNISISESWYTVTKEEFNNRYNK